MKNKHYLFYFLLLLYLVLSNSFDAVAQQTPSLTILSQEVIFSDPPFAQCHASSLIELKKDTYMAAWFGGSYESANDVCIWSSVKSNGKWSEPYRLVCGEVSDSLRYACWNPVLFRCSKKELILYYKVGVSPREWWGMKIHSSDNGITWSPASRLNGILGPVRNKAIVLTSGIWLNPSSTETTDRWKVFVERSADKGENWEVIPLDTVNSAKVIQPTLLVYPDGKIQALCRSNQNYILESWSLDEGKTWSSLQKTTVLNPNSGIDTVTLQSGLQLLVYNPMESGKDWVNGRNKLNLAYSYDGKSWTDIYKLEDQTEGEFSYPAIIKSEDGAIHISYTYNRKTIRYVKLMLEL
ncbi:MAG: sialidase family protein [Bacteroidota bacterium]